MIAQSPFCGTEIQDSSLCSSSLIFLQSNFAIITQYHWKTDLCLIPQTSPSTVYNTFTEVLETDVLETHLWQFLIVLGNLHNKDEISGDNLLLLVWLVGVQAVMIGMQKLLCEYWSH